MHTQQSHVQALKNPAPHFANHGNVARTMSVEQIVDVYQTITEGTAPLSVVYEWAFKAMALASQKVGDIDLSDLDDMQAPEARKALDEIESGRAYLKTISPAFARYPEISKSIESHLSALFYAEATLIPFYILANKTMTDRESQTSTYIVRHPLTGMIKIGRTVDVPGRIKSLQTGAGAILATLAVINGDLEQSLHKRFASLRRHGEWFEDVDGAISAFAAEQGESA
jgi:hypothetical protein